MQRGWWVSRATQVVCVGVIIPFQATIQNPQPKVALHIVVWFRMKTSALLGKMNAAKSFCFFFIQEFMVCHKQRLLPFSHTQRLPASHHFPSSLLSWDSTCSILHQLQTRVRWLEAAERTSHAFTIRVSPNQVQLRAKNCFFFCEHWQKGRMVRKRTAKVMWHIISESWRSLATQSSKCWLGKLLDVRSYMSRWLTELQPHNHLSIGQDPRLRAKSAWVTCIQCIAKVATKKNIATWSCCIDCFRNSYPPPTHQLYKLSIESSSLSKQDDQDMQCRMAILP